MLYRKMWRDVKSNLSQFITIFLMVFLGVLIYSGIRSYMDGMVETADRFYRDYNLQDLNVLGKFSLDDLDNIKDVDGVKKANAKLVVMGSMKHNEDRTLQLNFLESNDLSKFFVVEGISFDKNRSGVWLDSYFATNNHLNVGDVITIGYENIILEEEILGLIQVPDHVYDIKDSTAIFPNHIDYGFAYLSILEYPNELVQLGVMANMNITDETKFHQLVPDFDAQDYLTFNNIMVEFNEEVNKEYVRKGILENVSSALVVSDIEDSISYANYQGEIDEGETYVGVFSGLFLFVALLCVITTMTRVVKKQRLQIGTLKALGFQYHKIALHYVSYGFFISLVASILGFIIGPLFIGNLFIEMEMEYFQIPNGHAVVLVSSFFVVCLIIFLVCFVTYFTCRGVLKQTPAETLRSEMPKVKKESLNLTTKGFFRHFRFSTIWNIRDIIRNKIRTFMGIVGITGCTMLLVCAFGILDTMNHFVDLQYDQLYRFKYKITLTQDYTEKELEQLTKLYGSESSLTLAVEIRNNEVLDTNTIFVTDAKSYIHFVDKHNHEMTIDSQEGVYVTEKLAKLKHYHIGDVITWHIYGDEHYYESEIIGFNRDPQNQNITMTKEYLENLGLKYNPDTIYTNVDLHNEAVAGVSLMQDVSVLKDDMLSRLNTMKEMVVLLIMAAVVLGSVIIYNLGILSYTEKTYQFATLKVLGFKDKQIKKIYIKQNNLLTIVSIFLGLLLGYFMTDFIFKMALSDHFDFGAYIVWQTYVYAIIGTYLVSFITSKFLAKKIEKLDMVTSLKGNE